MSCDGRDLREEIVAALPRVRRFAFALTGTEADADDLLQTTVERVLRKGAPDGADLARWMFRVCKNIWIDEIRARRVRRVALEREMLGPADFVDGETVVMERARLNRVRVAMAQLPEQQRMALALFAFAGCTYHEAAAILDEPAGTIMSRISRARQALADILEPDDVSGTVEPRSRKG